MHAWMHAHTLDYEVQTRKSVLMKPNFEVSQLLSRVGTATKLLLRHSLNHTQAIDTL